MNAALASNPDKTQFATEIIYVRSVLELLKLERGYHAWLWEIRLKAVDYLVKRYNLESLADPNGLSEYQTAALRSCSPLLQVSSRSELPADSEEIRNIRQRVRKLFESVKQQFDAG